MSFNHSHLLNTKQFQKSDLEQIIDFSHDIENHPEKYQDLLKGKILSTLFYEASTRTRISFEAAMIKLGGSVISNPGMVQFSSVSKGETLKDTAKVIGSYCDIMAIRHPEKGSVEEFSKGSDIPTINAGDGIAEHPTQALLDMYTIEKSLGRINNFKIAFVGDLKYGRTVHSLVRLLRRFDNIEFVFVSPEQLKIPHKIAKKTNHRNTFCMNDGIQDVDIIYMTRIQKERFKNKKEYKKFVGVYHLNKTILDTLGDVKVMHPLPRVDELSTDLDNDPRSIYFDQVKNGLYVRMVIISLLLGHKKREKKSSLLCSSPVLD